MTDVTSNVCTVTMFVTVHLYTLLQHYLQELYNMSSNNISYPASNGSYVITVTLKDYKCSHITIFFVVV